VGLGSLPSEGQAAFLRPPHTHSDADLRRVVSGDWFVASSVLRDAAALAGVECLPWDYWGLGRSFCAQHRVTEEQEVEVDHLERDCEKLLRRQPSLAALPWGKHGQ